MSDGPPQAVVDEWNATLDDYSKALDAALRRHFGLDKVSKAETPQPPAPKPDVPS